MSTSTTMVRAPAITVAETSDLTTWDRFVGFVATAMAALLPIALSAQTSAETFVPKDALDFVLAAAGIVPLLRLAWSSRYQLQARLAIGFVAAATLSAVLSPSKLVGFFGLYLWGEGDVFLLSLTAAWAIGVSLTARTRRWLMVGLLVGSTANAIAAVVQTAFSLNTQQADLSGFGLFGGTQADGMMGNPIHLEAILLGGLALLLGQLCRARGRKALLLGVLVALHASALECSSERYALVLLALLVVYAAVAYRLRSIAYVAAVAAGFVATFLGGAGASLSQRVATSSAGSTYKLRLHAAWSGSLATLLHRPLLGFGPGQMRNSLLLYQSRSLAHEIGPGRFFTDLHDFLANMLVMTGLVGFALFAAFMVTSSWRVRGAFMGFAAAALAVELAEPMNVGVTPLAFLALGAALAASRGTPWEVATRARTPVTAPGGRATVVGWALLVVGLVPAVTLVVGGVFLHQAQLTFSLSKGHDANDVLPIWPQTADEIAQVYAYQSVVDLPAKQPDLVSSRDWAATAAARDPSDTVNWSLLAAADLQVHDYLAARTAGERAVADCPLCTAALTALGTSDGALGDWPGAVAEYRAALSVEPQSATLRTGLQKALAHDRTFFENSGA